MLRDTSAFDEISSNFSYRIVRVASALPLTLQFGAELSRRLDSARVERALEVLGEVADAKVKREKQVKALSDFAYTAAAEIVGGRCK